MNIIKISISPQAKIRERILAITQGKLRSCLLDPKIWFTSMHSLFHVFSNEGKGVRTGLREKMTKVNIRVDTLEGFFDRARKAAQKADRGEFSKTSITYSFEDIQDLPKVASETSRHLSSDTLDATH